MFAESYESGPTALIVDPHEDTRDLYAHTFGAFGWHTLQAEDGSVGLGLAISKAPSVMISEIRLPRLDGARVFEILRADETTASLPIVVVTGDARRTADAWKAGADAVLLKPITPDRLVATVHQELRRRSALALQNASQLRARAGRTIRKSLDIMQRRETLSRKMGRYVTTAPPTRPPVVRCDKCDEELTYVRSYIGGVNAGSGEQWDYLDCPNGCGTYQYRHRGRRLQRVE